MTPAPSMYDVIHRADRDAVSRRNVLHQFAGSASPPNVTDRCLCQSRIPVPFTSRGLWPLAQLAVSVQQVFRPGHPLKICRVIVGLIAILVVYLKPRCPPSSVKGGRDHSMNERRFLLTRAPHENEEVTTGMPCRRQYPSAGNAQKTAQPSVAASFVAGEAWDRTPYFFHVGRIA